MTMQELVAIIRLSDVPQEMEILPMHRLREDLLMTSFSMMLLFMNLEERIGHNIDMEMFANAITVNDLYELVKKIL